MEEEIVELEDDFIVLAVPKDTVEVTISAKVYHNGKLQDVHRTMPPQEVREAFQEAKHGYIPSDAIFTLTPLGEKYAEELIRNQRELFEEE